jgi:hypothetical protein
MSNTINKVYVINKNADGTLPEAKGEPIIDISDTTAIATDVRGGKKFYLKDGSPAFGDDSRPSNIGELTVTEFKNYTAETGTAWSQVFVEIPLEDKTGIVPSKEVQTITPSENYEAMKSVKIEKIPDEYIVPTGTKPINENGVGIDVTQYATVDVSVVSEEINLENKEITFTENTTEPYPIPLSEGYQGFKEVKVIVNVPGEVIPEWDGTLSYLVT